MQVLIDVRPSHVYVVEAPPAWSTGIFVRTHVVGGAVTVLSTRFMLSDTGVVHADCDQEQCVVAAVSEGASGTVVLEKAKFVYLPFAATTEGL